MNAPTVVASVPRAATAPAAAPEPMSAVDAAWFDMDRPRNPMVVAAILEFERVDNPARLASNLAARLLQQPRFRQRVAERAGRRLWVEDELRIGYHVRVHALRRPASDVDLRGAIAGELEQDLDRARPLWRIVVFPRGRRATVLFRAHHALADGIALMQLLLRASGSGGDAGVVAGPMPPQRHGPLAGVISRLEGVNELLESATGEIVEDLRDPERLRRHVNEARRALGAAARVAALPNDKPAPFRAPLGGHRGVAWTRALSLAAVREIAHRQHVTVNDVFLTALAGAFGRYLRHAGARVPESQNLRVSVPVNLRAPADGSLGNRFGLVLVDLPVGLEGWHARLDVIADRMAALKQSPEPRTVLAALAAAAHLPSAAERRLVNFIGAKAAAVVSNLAGPRERLTLAGARLCGIVFWPPQTAGVGIGVSLLSYAGHVSFGVSADAAHIPDPQRLVGAFCAELGCMLGRLPD